MKMVIRQFIMQIAYGVHHDLPLISMHSKIDRTGLFLCGANVTIALRDRSRKKEGGGGGG